MYREILSESEIEAYLVPALWVRGVDAEPVTTELLTKLRGGGSSIFPNLLLIRCNGCVDFSLLMSLNTS